MKKIAMVFLCAASVLPCVLSAEEAAEESARTRGLETALSAGFTFGNTFEHHDSATDYFGSPGANTDGYFFWNGGRFGLFYHASFLFPAAGAGKDNHDFQWIAMFGPAFRISFTEKLELSSGAGIGWNGFLTRYEEGETDYARTIINFGIGADAGLKFDLSDAFFIKGGATLLWTFTGRTTVHEKSSGGKRESDWTPKGSWTLNANPYVVFGVTIFSPKRDWKKEWEERKADPNRTRLGKPPRE